MFKYKKAIIFDLDNVLVNTLPLHNKLEVIVLEMHGAKTSIKRMQELTGTRIDHIFKQVLKENNLKATKKLVNQMEKEKNKLFFENLTELKPINGVKKFLGFCKKNGLKTAVCSGSKTMLAKKILEIAKINNYFEVVIGGDQVKKAKPFPDIYLLTAKKLGLKPSECIAVEDSCNGVLSAKKAGMKVFGFINPDSGEQDLSKADLLFKSFEELIKKIRRNIK